MRTPGQREELRGRLLGERMPYERLVLVPWARSQP